MTPKNKRIKEFCAALLFIVLFGVLPAYAWVDNTCTPPDCGALAPLHTGSDTQVKSGALITTGFRSYFDAFFDTDVTVSGDLHVGNGSSGLCLNSTCIHSWSELQSSPSPSNSSSPESSNSPTPSSVPYADTAGTVNSFPNSHVTTSYYVFDTSQYPMGSDFSPNQVDNNGTLGKHAMCSLWTADNNSFSSSHGACTVIPTAQADSDGTTYKLSAAGSPLPVCGAVCIDFH